MTEPIMVLAWTLLQDMQTARLSDTLWAAEGIVFMERWHTI